MFCWPSLSIRVVSGILLISSSLVFDTTIKADWQVPFKSHAQLHVHLAKDLVQVMVQQIQRYQSVPKLKKIQIK